VAGRPPDLIVIGAMKCGTTALHRYLAAHPEIAMAAPKELNFFVGPEAPGDGWTWHRGNWHRGLEWYASQFGQGARILGEASPSYTSPSFSEAAERIAAVVADVRLVYLVRDPVDRALSQYAHHRAEGSEPRPVAEALLDDASQYVARSRYHERLAPYLERFPRERVAVVLQEDLLAARRPTLAAIYRFLGVDDGFWCDELEQRVHVGGSDGRDCDRALVDALSERLSDDVARLRELTGRDLAEWRAY